MIKEFKGEMRWLSNFYPAQITYLGFSVPTNEHAFQLAKATDRSAMAMVAACSSARAAKHAGRHLGLREDWEDVKDAVMLEITLLKFCMHRDLRQKLLDTGAQHLVEGNTWGDLYWGADLRTMEGRNQLGETLMLVRRMFGQVDACGTALGGRL
jgi:ribA/ribD-fused uncharacterized protein